MNCQLLFLFLCSSGLLVSSQTHKLISDFDSNYYSAYNIWLNNGQSRGSEKFKNYVEYPGDVLLSAWFPIHVKGSCGKQCCGLNIKDGPQMVEAMIYALDIINSQQGKFLNFSLGAIAMDTCANADYTLTEVMSLMQALRYRTEKDEQLLCPNGSQPEFKDHMKDYPKVVGVVGSMNSDVTRITAYLLNLFSIPQVGYYASTSDLNQGDTFHYFFRTNPPEKTAIKAILKLLRQAGWNYVAIVSDTSGYALNVLEDFQIALRTENQIETSLGNAPICLSEKIKIDLKNHQDYKDAVKSLSLGNPGSVVLVLLPHEPALEFFDTVRRFDKINENFLQNRHYWIGLSGWAGRDMDVEMNTQILTRTIAVIPTVHILKNFTEYMKRQYPSVSKNPWMQDYFESKCNCHYANNTLLLPDCLVNETECARKVFYNYKQLPFVQFIVNAFFAYAHALKTIQDTKCADLSSCELTARNFTGEEIREALQGVRFEDLTGREFSFKENDVTEDFSIIYNYENGVGWDVASTFSLKDIDKKGTRLNLSLEFEDYIHKITSICEKPCEPFEVKWVSKDNPCCWKCSTCSKNQIRKKSERHHNQPWEDEYNCEDCHNNTRPNRNLTHCEDLPKQFFSYSDPIAIVVIAYSLLGIFATLFVCFILFKYHNTPIVKASGRETSFVLLCGILLSFVCPILILSEPNVVSCGTAFISPGLCTCICYAAILAKTTRIARIFQMLNRATNKKLRFTSPLSQVYLMSSMILTEVAILLLMIAFDVPKIKNHPEKEIIWALCSKHQGQRIILPGLAFPIILILLSTLYAFKIRKTPRFFNEGRNLCYLNMANSGIYMIGILVLYIFPENQHWILCICFLLSIAATTSLLGAFINKLYIILFRQSKNTQIEAMSRTRFSTESISLAISLDSNPKVEKQSSIDSRTSIMSLDTSSSDNFSKAFPLLVASREQARESSTSSNSENTAAMQPLHSPLKMNKSVSFDTQLTYLHHRKLDHPAKKNQKPNKVSPINNNLSDLPSDGAPYPSPDNDSKPVLNESHNN